jgi:ribose 5-phosphate isomerase B
MRVAIGSDHRGVSSVEHIAEQMRSRGHEVVMIAGPVGSEPCDYPDAAYRVGRAVAEGRADTGVLVCGTGIGVSIAANKVHGVRAAVAHDEITAALSRTHNDANVLCLSADLLGQRLIEKIVDKFMASEFEGGRHARRLAKVAAIEAGHDPATVNGTTAVTGGGGNTTAAGASV